MQARTDTENWCGVLQEVALPGSGGDPEQFLEAAVAYANDRCWGTLSCSLMASCPPQSALSTALAASCLPVPSTLSGHGAKRAWQRACTAVRPQAVACHVSAPCITLGRPLSFSLPAGSQMEQNHVGGPSEGAGIAGRVLFVTLGLVQVPPDVSAAHAEAVESAVAALRYGSININVVTMLGFCVPKLTWGAFPGNTPHVRTHLHHPSSSPLSRSTFHLAIVSCCF